MVGHGTITARPTLGAPSSLAPLIRARRRLLPISLDDLGVAYPRRVFVEPGLMQRTSLVGQILTLVERHLERIEPPTVALARTPLGFALPQLMLLGDELLDPAVNLFVVHRAPICGRVPTLSVSAGFPPWHFLPLRVDSSTPQPRPRARASSFEAEGQYLAALRQRSGMSPERVTALGRARWLRPPRSRNASQEMRHPSGEVESEPGGSA